MIIIKISILHFIQIGHTDEFPSTGTRLVLCNDLYYIIMLMVKWFVTITTFHSIILVLVFPNPL